MTQENCNSTNPVNPSKTEPNVNVTPRAEKTQTISVPSIDLTPKQSTTDGNIKPVYTEENLSQGSGGSVNNGGNVAGNNTNTTNNGISSGNKTQNIKEQEKQAQAGEENRCPHPSQTQYSILDPGEDQYSKSHGKEIEGKLPCDKASFPARSIYPFNKIKQSESGHFSEIDDTPGGERISYYHRTGSGYEIEPMGSVRAMTVRDHWFSVYRDFHLHVDGYTHAIFDKGLRVIVNNEQIPNTEKESVNFDIYVNGKSNVNLTLNGGNVNIKINNGDVNLLMNDGDVNIRQEKGNYNHFVNGNYNLEVTGNMHTVIKGNELREIGQNREIDIGNNDELHVSRDLIIDCSGSSTFFTEGSHVLIANMRITSITNNDYAHIGIDKQEHILGNYYVKSNGIINLYSNGILNLTSVNRIEISSTRLDSCDIYSPNYNKGSKPTSGLPVEVDRRNYSRIYSVSQQFPATPSRKRDN
jgi:hypothetical protein